LKLSSGVSHDTQTQNQEAPSARLSPFGALMFSEAARRRFQLTAQTRCRLYFDRARLMVGVELLPDDHEVNSQGGGIRTIYATPRSAHVMLTTLLRSYEIDAALNTPCPVVAEQHNGIDLIAIDLKPAVEAQGDTTPRCKCCNRTL